MLTAAAYMLETRLLEHDLTAADVHSMGWGCLLGQDTSGGGLTADIMNLVCSMLEGIDADPQEMVEVIVYWYFLLLSEDLPFCPLTWRPLAVTALMAAMKGTLPEQSAKLRGHILCSIAHWWSIEKVNHALEKFSARQEYNPKLFGASVYAKIFFSLRDVALRCEEPSGSSFAENGSTNDHSSTTLIAGVSKEAGVRAAIRNKVVGSDHTFSFSRSSSFHDDCSETSLSSLRCRSQRGTPQATPCGNVSGGHLVAATRPVEPIGAPTHAPVLSCKISL